MSLAPGVVQAANTGGVMDKPARGDYTGSLNGIDTTPTGGNVRLDSSVTGTARGGSAATGNVTGNTLTIVTGAVTKNAQGGGTGAGDARNNSVTMSGGSVTNSIRGGVSEGTGNATGNQVTITGGTVDGSVIGATITNGDAVGNAVTFTGGKAGFLYGANSSNGATGNLTGNTVTLTGGTVVNAVQGAYLNNDSGGSGSATGNTVNISGGSVGGGLGTAAVIGGRVYSGTVTGNTVNISGGTIGGATANVSKNVVGGYIGKGGGSATGNTLNISGSPVFHADTELYGGFQESNPTVAATDLRTGNTLNIFTSGITVKNIANFQNYNFAMSGMSDAPLLTLTGTDAAAFQSGDVVRVAGVQSGQRLAVGHSNTLLSATTAMTGLSADMLPNGQAQQGASLLYDYALVQSADNKSLTTTITGVQAAPQGKALSEGRAAALGFTLLGADLAAGAGMDNARTVTSGKGLSGGDSANGGGGMGLMPFFAMSASSMRYNSGSHTDVNGMALMAGLAKKWEAPAADVLLGAFFEAGFGSYKAHNSFATGSVDGKGDTRSTGGGILARVDMTDTALKGLYAEASFRLGGLFSDYNSSDLRDMAGNSASYDMNSTYYGAHAGLGYIWNFTDKAALDVYAKYFWTHQTGQDVTILGDKFSFKDMDSQRVRLGGRFSYAVTEGFAPYVGAAWEHEFDGKARATTYGLDVPAPSLKGSTGVGELGISWKPANATGFSVDLGAQGFIGQREGVSGNLMLKYEF